MAKTTINTAALHSALDAARQERQISWRALAGEIGVSPSLLSRLGNGLKPDTDGFATIVAWLTIPETAGKTLEQIAAEGEPGH